MCVGTVSRQQIFHKDTFHMYRNETSGSFGVTLNAHITVTQCSVIEVLQLDNRNCTNNADQAPGTQLL